MNYKNIYEKIVSNAEEEQRQGLRPKTKNQYKIESYLYLWYKNIPFHPKEIFILYEISPEVFGKKIYVQDAHKFNSARAFANFKERELQEKYREKIKSKKIPCKKCGTLIRKESKTGYCVHCKGIVTSGINNPFFGRKHSQETINKIKEKNSVASKKLWENPEYREKVISHATGVKRSEEFKEKQRKNTIIQMKDSNQRAVRSIFMKKSWDEGILSYHNTISGRNFSKEELQFGEALRENLGEKSKELKRGQIILGDTPDSPKKFYLPDFVFRDKYIIEYLGDYWHCNPKRFKPTDKIKYNIVASEQWEKDRRRKEYLESKGYEVLEVWGSDFTKYPDEVIKSIIEKITQP